MKSIKQPETSITNLFYEGVPVITGDEDIDQPPFFLKEIAEICTEVVYVIDFLKRSFHYAVNRDFFFYGHSVEDVLTMGYDFYPKVIHPKDLSMFAKMHATILRRVCTEKNPAEINYYSFAVRVKTTMMGYIMTYHRIKPVFIEGQVRFGICMFESSVLKKSGNLRAYYHNFMGFDEYIDGVWKRNKEELLTLQEKRVLVYARQGKVNKEIANMMNLEFQSVRNILNTIYHKLNVKTMTQAITFAVNRHLIYQPVQLAKTKLLNKNKQRRRMTPIKLKQIQEKLNKGQSVNSIANQEDMYESNIRYYIKTGKILFAN